jgi:hypothetical protein
MRCASTAPGSARSGAAAWSARDVVGSEARALPLPTSGIGVTRRGGTPAPYGGHPLCVKGLRGDLRGRVRGGPAPWRGVGGRSSVRSSRRADGFGARRRALRILLFEETIDRRRGHRCRPGPSRARRRSGVTGGR